MSVIAIRLSKPSSKAAAALAVAGGLLAAFASATPAHGAVINYGNSPNVAPGVTFLNVTESSGTDTVPLYGAPDYFTTGVDFDPATFVAFSAGGGGDITDGQLNFILQGDDTPSQLVAIDQLSLFESGDYTLTGTGTTASQLTMGAIIFVTVTEIDGAAIAPLNLTPVSASVGYNLVANPGVAQPWSLGLTINIESQLTTLGVPHSLGATRIEVAINDTLVALSETSTASFAAKKDFRIEAVSDVDVVPEPAALGLIVLAAPLLSRRRR